jgi:hypothetical protein
MLGYGGTEPSLWLYAVARPVPPDETSGLHFCFAAPTREGVDAFHAAALRLGGVTTGSPGCVPITVPDTTPPSWLIPTATGSRRTMVGRSAPAWYAALHNSPQAARRNDQSLCYSFYARRL